MLAVSAFWLFLRRTAFRTELGTLAKLCTAFDARHLGRFHFAAAIRTELYAGGVQFPARGTRNAGSCLGPASARTAARALLSKSICHLSAHGEARAKAGT